MTSSRLRSLGHRPLHYLTTLWYRERRTEYKTKNKASRYTALRLINPDVMLLMLQFVGNQVIASYNCYNFSVANNLKEGLGVRDARRFVLLEMIGDYPMSCVSLYLAFLTDTHQRLSVRHAKWIAPYRLVWEQ